VFELQLLFFARACFFPSHLFCWQVMNAAGAAFVFTSPTGLGRNAFYWEEFSGGVVDATNLDVCFEKSGGVVSVQYSPAHLPLSPATSGSPTMSRAPDDPSLQRASKPIDGEYTIEIALPSVGGSQTSRPPTTSTAITTKEFASPNPSAFINRSPGELPQASDLKPGASSVLFNGVFKSPKDSPRTQIADASPESRASSPPPSVHFEAGELMECDFAALAPGDFVTTGLLETCLMEITAFSLDLDGSQLDSSRGGPAQVLDSSNPVKRNIQLGSPNQDCPDAGPGEGTGGSPLHQPIQEYQNCKARGNLLIVPERVQDAIDPIPVATGGCLIFHFLVPVVLKGAGILDIPAGTTAMYTVSSFFGAAWHTSPGVPPSNGCHFIRRL
jgi:hypothetical protein